VTPLPVRSASHPESVRPTCGPAGASRPRAERSAANSRLEDLATLRGEHDALAERLAVRRSIDLVRRGAYTAFAGFIATGLAAKLAFERWFSLRLTRFDEPPILFFIALAAALALVALALVAFRRARRLMRAEDAEFARFRELRARLELDP